MKRNLVVGGFTLVLLVAWSIYALPPKSPHAATAQQGGDEWKAYRFILGKWTGDALGPEGHGPGTVTAVTDLDGSILRLENAVEFTGGSVSYRDYRSTMIVSHGNKALFLDSEGHVVHYTVHAENNSIVFSGPRVRMTYQAVGDNKLKCTFDMAPIDTPNDFTMHVTGEAVKQ